MLFNSAVFLFIFLPIVLSIYFLCPQKYRNFFLVLSSLSFYSWGEQEIVLIMLLSIIVDYNCGLFIGKGYKKTGLFVSILVNLTILGIFKYANFAFENYNLLISYLGLDSSLYLSLPNIALPIGISFYTFQTMSYSIDVYRGKVLPNKNFIDFATYVTFFPQLIAGPIVRYIDIEKQLFKRKQTFDNLSVGIERFIIGLSKKMIFANIFAEIADGVFFHSPADLSIGSIWLGIIAYSLQIYFDFSAYSDMAIGLSRIFGFHIPENFNYPYVSKSIKEFWRRWHISLSSWFRDYLYISLGGNRVSTTRLYLNLLTVFFITGLWHGASWNFIVWGLFHGFFLILERIGLDSILDKFFSSLRVIYTLLVVLIGWVFFRTETLVQAIEYIQGMFYINQDAIIYPDLFLTYYNIFILLLGIILAMPVFISSQTKLKSNTYSKILYYTSLIALFIYSVSLVAAATYNPFIYFRF